VLKISGAPNFEIASSSASRQKSAVSLERVRVNDAVQNFEEFGKAFQCTKGKAMSPEKSCRVW
jgi:predicted metalloendopeptidase